MFESMTYFQVSLPCVHHQCTQKSISFILHECLKKLFCLLVSSRINAVYSPSFSPLLSIDFFRFFGDGSSVKRPLLEYNETKKPREVEVHRKCQTLGREALFRSSPNECVAFFWPKDKAFKHLRLQHC